VGVQPETLKRWRDEALSMPARERAWTAAARFDAVLSTATMDEASKSAWCRAQGVYPQDLEGWRQSATAALSDPSTKQAAPRQAQQDKQRIKELERELLRKERALAETAALLVLSKKVAVIFNRGEDE
jgi:transposase-like protein